MQYWTNLRRTNELSPLLVPEADMWMAPATNNVDKRTSEGYAGLSVFIKIVGNHARASCLGQHLDSITTGLCNCADIGEAREAWEAQVLKFIEVLVPSEEEAHGGCKFRGGGANGMRTSTRFLISSLGWPYQACPPETLA